MLIGIGRFAPFTSALMTVATTKSEIVEGETIEFTIDSRWVPPGTMLKYKIIGTATAADFNEGEGTIVTEASVTRLVLTAKNDETAEGDEQFSLGIYSMADVLIAQSSSVVIRDTSIPVGVGQREFLTPGSTTEFIVPPGVTMIHAVLVGGGCGGSSSGRVSQYEFGYGYPAAGGGLRWINNLPVTPGEILQVTLNLGGYGGSWVDKATSPPWNGTGVAGGDAEIRRKSTGERLIWAGGGGSANGGTGSPLSAVGASPIAFIGGGNGGAAGFKGAATGTTGGAGGAGGYSGAGGRGSAGGGNGSPGVGGGGGGGWAVGAGGGVGLLGQGANGIGGTSSTYGGGAGSGGAAGTQTVGGNYGGGGAPARANGSTSIAGGVGGRNAVRIIWGNGRAFPSTKTGNL